MDIWHAIQWLPHIAELRTAGVTQIANVWFIRREDSWQEFTGCEFRSSGVPCCCYWWQGICGADHSGACNRGSSPNRNVWSGMKPSTLNSTNYSWAVWEEANHFVTNTIANIACNNIFPWDRFGSAALSCMQQNLSWSWFWSVSDGREHVSGHLSTTSIVPLPPQPKPSPQHSPLELITDNIQLGLGQCKKFILFSIFSRYPVQGNWGRNPYFLPHFLCCLLPCT